MKAWPEILEECKRHLSEAAEKGSSGERLHHCARPEAAFRIKLRENPGGSKSLESVVGGIPKIVTSTVHSVTRLLSSCWLPPEKSEQPIGVLTRGPRREDLYVFYRECDASLVLYTQIGRAHV